MKVALYLRISTDRQTVESQTLELRDYCSRRGWGKVTEYSDTASGSKLTRAGLDALMRDIRRGRVDAVVAYRLDRLGRSLGHLVPIISKITTHCAPLILPCSAIA